MKLNCGTNVFFGTFVTFWRRSDDMAGIKWYHSVYLNRVFNIPTVYYDFDERNIVGLSWSQTLFRTSGEKNKHMMPA